MAVGSGALVLAGSSAQALSHTSVTVGGSASPAGSVNVTGENANDIVFTTDFGVELTCQDSTISGEVDRGATVDVGQEVGRITNLHFTNCTATALGFPVDVTMSGGDFVVRDHPANPGDPVPVTIEDVDAHVKQTSGSACEMWATGTVDAVINEGTNGSTAPDGEIELVPADFSTGNGFDLDIQAGDGSGNPATSSCGGEVWTGDKAGPWKDGAGNASVFELDTNGAGDISHS